MKQRIEWLAVLRGLNILLVVMVHVQLVDMSTGQNHTFCNALSFPFHPIRMPLFIFISGGLLYLSRIRKDISTKALYKDKFQRIMIPFVFFVVVYYLIKVVCILSGSLVTVIMVFGCADVFDAAVSPLPLSMRQQIPNDMLPIVL